MIKSLPISKYTTNSVMHQTIHEAAQQQRAAWEEEQKNKRMIAWLMEGRQMDLYDIRLTTDPDYPDKVEIEMLENGVGVEGGQFDLAGLILAIKRFYNENY